MSISFLFSTYYFYFPFAVKTILGKKNKISFHILYLGQAQMTSNIIYLINLNSIREGREMNRRKVQF